MTVFFKNELKTITDNLAQKFKNNIVYDLTILKECDIKIQQYLQTLDQPSEYKVAGSIMFWIRKLKPFSFQQGKSNWTNPCLHLNEIVAVIYSYLILHSLKKEMGKKTKKLHTRFINDLATQLRYSSFSPSSLEMLIASQYQQ